MWLKIVRQELQNNESYSESFEVSLVLAWFIFENNCKSVLYYFLLHTHAHIHSHTHTC